MDLGQRCSLLIASLVLIVVSLVSRYYISEVAEGRALSGETITLLLTLATLSIIILTIMVVWMLAGALV